MAAKSKGFEVHIATKFSKYKNYLNNLGLITHDLPIERSSLSIISNLITFSKIYQLLRIVKPNLIHLITIKPVLFGCINSYFFKKISIVCSVSGLGFIFSDKGLFSFFRRQFISYLYKLSFRKRNLIVIFQNKNDKQTLLKITNLKEKDSRIIDGSGVDLNKFAVNHNSQKPPIVLFAGRLLVSKGILDFIESSKYLNNIRFVISGEFDRENPDCINSRLIERFQSEGLIEYWGYSDNMVDIINQSSIVVLPSYYGEGLPKILIEAAACGKPVITTDHPGCRDAIINNVSGLLIPIKSPISIANAINKIISDKKLLKSMGREARLLAEKKFSIDSVISEHIYIYNNLIKE